MWHATLRLQGNQGNGRTVDPAGTQQGQRRAAGSTWELGGTVINVPVVHYDNMTLTTRRKGWCRKADARTQLPDAQTAADFHLLHWQRHTYKNLPCLLPQATAAPGSSQPEHPIFSSCDDDAGHTLPCLNAVVTWWCDTGRARVLRGAVPMAHDAPTARAAYSAANTRPPSDATSGRWGH